MHPAHARLHGGTAPTPAVRIGASAKKRRAVRRPAAYDSSAVAAVINTSDTTTEAEMANPAISVSPSIHIT